MYIRGISSELERLELSDDIVRCLCSILNSTVLDVNIVPGIILRRWLKNSLKEMDEEYYCLSRNLGRMEEVEKKKIRIGCEDVGRWLEVCKDGGFGSVGRVIMLAYVD